MLGVNGAPHATLILLISCLFLSGVCTLPGCLLPNSNPIGPDERASTQTGNIVPNETLVWEATTFAFIHT